MRDRIVKQLDNGLKIAYKRNRSKEAVYLEFRFGSGLNNDPKDKLGLAHFVEHCAGLTNSKFSQQEKTDYRMKLYYANFSTGKTFINFYTYVSDEELEEVFAHLVNTISDFVVPEDEFENERKVINQEILRYRKDLAGEMFYTIRETLYSEATDIRIRPFGTLNTVSSITKQDILDYAKKCFVLDNCLLTVYGNVSYLKIKKLIKKYMIPNFENSSGTHFLKPSETIAYSNTKPCIIINPSPDDGKSRIRVLHKVHLNNIVRMRNHAVALLNSIFETAASEFFRAKYGLCYASSIKFAKSISINNDHDVLELNVVIDCDQSVVKEVVDKLPEFYNYLQNYSINSESLEKAQTILRRYEKCTFSKNFIKSGESMADSVFNDNIHYTYRQNKKYKKEKEKIQLEFVIDVFKTILKTQPFIFIVSNTEDILQGYDTLKKSIDLNSEWIDSL